MLVNTIGSKRAITEYHSKALPNRNKSVGYGEFSGANCRTRVVTGLSDHTLDNSTAIASVAMGASIIEKHFTLDRSGGGLDDSFSLEPSDLAALCKDVKTAWSAIGNVDYGRKSSEQGNIKFRRSLYFVKDLIESEIITEDAVRSIRPGFGIAPKYFEEVIGKRMKASVTTGTPVKFEHFS
jgi:N-acetylneuraminate synthase